MAASRARAAPDPIWRADRRLTLRPMVTPEWLIGS
jgi:hypothetical protein